MRLFVCEFITGGGCHGAALPATLAAEGAMMRDAVLRDLLELGGHEITITLDTRLPAPALPIDVRTIDGDVWEMWDRCLEACESALIIAPETGGILERLNGMVLAHGKALLGCEPAAVAVAASKLATARRLAAQGIAVVSTVSAGEVLPAGGNGWVIKPDDGAGSDDTCHFDEATKGIDPPTDEAAPHRVVQPYLPGDPLSLSVLYGPKQVVLLGVNSQIVTRGQNRLRQTGVIVNARVDRQARMRALAEAVGRACPGLRGYVGIDVIDTGEEAVVLEVNPRLTTAYVGLRDSLGCNPAALMLRAFGDEAITPPDLSSAKAIRVDMK